jgi:Na+/melibiose symporter-like transporter
MFYSNTIFASIGSISSVMITFYVGLVNFIATFGGLFLLFKMGRRAIMLNFGAIMAAILILVGISSLKQAEREHEIELDKEHAAAIDVDPSSVDTSNVWTGPTVLLVLSFIAVFEFSSGPITWLYMAEIMQDKSVSMATVLNWLMNLVISIITPSLVKAIGNENIGYIFITMGMLTTCGTLFVYTFMLETRGKSPQEIEAMFSQDKEYSRIEDSKGKAQDTD